MKVDWVSTIALTKEYSSRIQSKLPNKLKDLGSFTIQVLTSNQLGELYTYWGEYKLDTFVRVEIVEIG